MHIKTVIISRLRSPSFAMLAACLAVGSLSACDTLWNGFTIADPRSCATKMGEVTCQAPQICNPNTGLCENGSDLLTITPNMMPMNAGQPVELKGSLISSDTIVRIAGQALLPPLSGPAGNVVKGIVAKSPGRCGPVDVELVRSAGPPFVGSGAFTYTFEPFTVKPPTNLMSNIGSISRIFLANLDDDRNGQMDLVLRTANGPQAILNAATSPMLPMTLPVLAGMDQHIAVARVSGNTRSVLILGDTVQDANSKSSITILAWDETRSMYLPKSPGAVPGQIKHIMTFDSNHDGTDEVTIISQPPTSQTNTTITIMYHNGTNWLIYQSNVLLANQAVVSISAGDVNNDKMDDLVMTTANQPGITGLSALAWDGVRLNPVPTPASPKGIYTAVATGDWDGDNRIDIALSTGLANPITTLLNKPSGWMASSFNTTATASFSQTELIATDVNCDLKPDLVVNNYTVGQGNWSGIFINDGKGGFSERRLPSTKNGPVIIADLNKDSLPDLLNASADVSGANQAGIQLMIGYAP